MSDVELKPRDLAADIFRNVNDWLRFAEAKNAALIALASAALWASIKVIVSNDIHLWIAIYAVLAAAQFAVSILIGLISFIPALSLDFIVRRSRPSGADNLLYFGHIANYSKRDMRERLFAACGGDPNRCSDIENAYIEQIIINSRIANHKFGYFNVACWIFLSGLVTPLGSVLCYLAFKDKNHGLG